MATIDVFLICGVIFVISRMWFGDYSRRTLFWEGARATTQSLILLSFADIGISFASSVPIWPHIITSWAALIILVPLLRQLARAALKLVGLWEVSAVLVGAGPNVIKVYSALTQSLSLGFGIREIVYTAPENVSGHEASPVQFWIARDEREICDRLHSAQIEQVIIVPSIDENANIGGILQRLIGADLRVLVVPQLRGIPLYGLNTTYFFGYDLLLLNARNSLARLPSRIIKRLADLIGSITLILLLSPLLAIIVILIKQESNGPAIFIQKRVGRNRTLFSCLKFRTMVVDAEHQLVNWRLENPELYEEYVQSNFKLKQDPRVTRVGYWLRKSSLDELPQIFNVLMGSMSLVGPRPLLSRELSEYGAAIDLYYLVRPGITGLWQTRGRSDTQFQDRITFDEWYILNWSFWYDIVILIQTAWILFTGKGAY